MKTKTKQLCVRVPIGWIARAKALTPKVSKVLCADLKTLDVVRMALLAGFDALDAKVSEARPSGR